MASDGRDIRNGAGHNNGQTQEHYVLYWGGQAYDLVWKGSGAEYTTRNYMPLRIWRCSTTSVCNGIPALGSGSNESGAYWQVQSPDGALYLFGNDAVSERFFYVSECNSYVITPEWTKHWAQAWYVRRVYAPVRDDHTTYPGRWTAEYNYTNPVRMSGGGIGGGWDGWCNQYAYDLEVQLTDIRYGNSLYRA